MLSLTNPYAKTATILVVASVLLLAGITVIGPSLASDGPAVESKKVSATGATASTVIDTIADKTIGNLQYQTRRILLNFTGDVQGRATMLQTITTNSTSKIANSMGMLSFTGTIAGRSGSFTAMQTLISDRTNPSLYVFKSRITVLEGSGMEGLEGICGGGTTLGSGPPAGPFTTTYDFTFRFGEACNSANP